MYKTLSLLRIGLISLCILIVSSQEVISQDYISYEEGKTNLDIGLTVGTALFYRNIELSFLVSRRLSTDIVVDARPLAGLITQALIFEGNNGRYRVPYFGGTIGLSLGRKSKFFEVGIGSAYFVNVQSAWGDSARNVLPVVTLGYKKKFRSGTFRVGLGFPNGLYMSMFF